MFRGLNPKPQSSPHHSIGGVRRDATRPCADPYATSAENSFFCSASKSTQALLLLSCEHQLRFRYFLCHFLVPLFVGDAMLLSRPPIYRVPDRPLFFSLFFHLSENSRISAQNGRFIAFLTTSFLAQFAAQERRNISPRNLSERAALAVRVFRQD